MLVDAYIAMSDAEFKAAELTAVFNAKAIVEARMYRGGRKLAA